MIPIYDRQPTEGLEQRRKLTPVGNNLYDVEFADQPEVIGTPVNRALFVERLAFSGKAVGTASKLELDQEAFTLFDGAPGRIQVPVTLDADVTLAVVDSVNNTRTNDIKILDVQGKPTMNGIIVGTWISLLYSLELNAWILQGGGGGSFIGEVRLFYGTLENIPDGWAWCNGEYGTPDMRNKTPVGAGDLYDLGDTGGTNSVILSVSQLPSHGHLFINGLATRIGGHIHRFLSIIFNSGNYNASGQGWIADSIERYTDSAGEHEHTVTGTISNTGLGAPIDIRQPYCALYYIMRIF